MALGPSVLIKEWPFKDKEILDHTRGVKNGSQKRRVGKTCRLVQLQAITVIGRRER